jgi:putative hydrolase of the HAD superfamily
VTVFGAAVFDLFGTLVPEVTKSEFRQTLTAMATILEVDGPAFERGWVETGLERQTGVYADLEENIAVICRSIDREPTKEKVARAIERRLELYRRWFHPRVGAVETLTELKRRGYPVALISMCTPDTPALWRASVLAPFVDVTVFSSESGLRKPDPAIYLAATEALGISPEDCVYCGDGAYGELSGARFVGMTTYLIRDAGLDPAEMLTPEPEEHWDGAVVADLRELLELFPA